MKKRVKKLVVIALTVALFVTSVLPALAVDHSHHGGDDETKLSPGDDAIYTITLKAPEGVEDSDSYMNDSLKFGAYQIFSGTVDASLAPTPVVNPGEFASGASSKKLPITDIKWGNAFGTVGNEDWMRNVVGFALALGTAKSSDFFHVDFDDFHADSDCPLVDEDGNLLSDYISGTSEISSENIETVLEDELKKVNYDKLAVAVAEVVADQTDREWLQAFADILGGYETSDSDPKKYTESYVKQYYGGQLDSGNYKITVPAGYYMLIDQTSYEAETAKDVAYSARMLFVAYDIEQEIKESVPTLAKKVVRDDGEYDTEAAGVGDLVNFRLTGTLPSNYLNYLEGYQYKFEDTPEGLTIKPKDGETSEYVTVTAKGLYVSENKGVDWNWESDAVVTISKDSYDKDGSILDLSHKHIGDEGSVYTETLAADGTLTVSFPCLEEILVVGDGTNGEDGSYYYLGYDPVNDKSSEIRVDYTAEVNEDALVGTSGNTNTAKLHYSNNPQAYDDTAETTENATVYTFGLDIIKVDAAEFFKNDGNVEAAGVALKDVKFALVRREKTSSDPDIYQWQIAKFEFVNADIAGGLSGIPTAFEKGYYTISEWENIEDGGEEVFDETWLSDAKYAGNDYNIATLEGGYLNVSGIDDGVKYTLVETTVPVGYAKIKPFTVTVTAYQDDDEYNGTLSAVTSESSVDGKSFSYDKTVQLLNPISSSPDNDGSAGMYVANFKYENLPSTGGIGTWIYYIIGGVTVAGALVLFILAGRKSRKA